MDFSALPSLSVPVKTVARTDFVRLDQDETIEQALNRLRSATIGERIIYFYVTDSEGKLKGVVPTRRLLLSDPSRKVGEVMISPVVSIGEWEAFGDAVKLLTSYRYLAVPVVDREGRMTGVVDVAGYAQEMVDLERREAAEELFQLAGIHIEQEQGKSAFWVVGNRFPWLISNILSGLTAAYISNHFDHLLRAVVALAFFVPLVLALAESIAMQSVTVSLNQLRMGRRLDAPGSTLREVRTGLLLGILCGLIVGIMGVIWLGLYRVALAVGLGIVMSGVIGATIGYVVPRLVLRWKLDPRIASGPAGLALTDVVTLTSYFTIAGLILTA